MSSAGTSGPPLHVEILAHLPVLPLLSTQLRETAQEIQASVATVCENFQDMAKRTRDTVHQASTLVSDRAAPGNVAAMFETSRVTLGHLLNRMEHSDQLSLQAIGRMEEVELVMRQVTTLLGELDRIAVSNRLLAVNAKIQAAQLGMRGAGFGVVADEVSSLSRRSNQLTEQADIMLRALGVKMSGVAEGLRQQAAGDHKRARDSRSEVEAALDGLEGAHGQMETLLSAAAANGERLAVDIAEAVMGLQFQDRVDQRIHHVVKALEEMHTCLAEEAQTTGSGRVDDAFVQRVAQRREEVLGRVLGAHTMESERRVRAQHAGGAGTGPGSSGAVELFSGAVELF
jgi:methyl-accepting chemotaxis protein